MPAKWYPEAGVSDGDAGGAGSLTLTLPSPLFHDYRTERWFRRASLSTAGLLHAIPAALQAGCFSAAGLP
jgi:hypothetical protein